MKVILNKKLKIILNILFICLFLFGYIGFAIIAINNMGGKAYNGKYYNQYPLNDKNGIAVDSMGNIYIGEGERSCIQVYDINGNFQYGFNIPTAGGGFVFGVYNDMLYIITFRTSVYLIINQGKLISQEEIDYDKSIDLQQKYNMSDSNMFIKNNIVYKISMDNVLSIENKLTDDNTKIKLNTPAWPFSILIFWLMVAIGGGLIFLINHKKIVQIFKSFNYKYKK